MINQVVLVGRIKQMPVIDKDDELHDADMVMQVMRPFASSDGTYACDDVLVSMWNGQAGTLNAGCHQGDLIGLKGRIEQVGQAGLCKIIAEKIAVLQPNSMPLSH